LSQCKDFSQFLTNPLDKIEYFIYTNDRINGDLSLSFAIDFGHWQRGGWGPGAAVHDRGNSLYAFLLQDFGI